MNAQTSADPDHPSPQRDRVKPSALLPPLAAGPLAWVVQLLVSYAFSSNVCMAARRGGALLTSGAAARETVILLATNLACLALALGAATLSWFHWRRRKTEKPGKTKEILSTGEGRSRFLATVGVISSLGFSIGILFNTVEPFMIKACWIGTS
jgi:hypothetical protein